MKKLSVFFLIFGMAFVVLGQPVPREMVVLEIGTGTWCTYCPGAAMGADDLVEGGAHVAVCENHNGDAFANNYSNARNSYYNISGYPTAKFDGVLTYVGGSHTQSMAPQYYPLYNQRIVIPTNLSMSMAITNSGLDYTATITLVKTGSLASGLKLRFCTTVSNITYNWQGQTHLNFVNALMVPDATGTTVDFSGGDTQIITLNFSIDATWPVEDIEFIAFVQNDNGKEILQGIKRAAVDLEADFVASTTQVNKDEEVTFTDLTTGGYIHAPVVCHWFFPGATPDTSSQPEPTVTYTECGPHDVTLIVDKGGQLDTVVKNYYINVGPIVNISATPNDTICHFETMTLDATTANAASYSWQPGGATTPTIAVSYPNYGFGSHTFTVTVTGNDGCISEKSITVVIDNCTGIPGGDKEVRLTLSPNPNNGNFRVGIEGPAAQSFDLTVTNLLGIVVYREADLIVENTLQKELRMEYLPAGVYFVSLQNGQERITRKMVIN